MISAFEMRKIAKLIKLAAHPFLMKDVDACSRKVKIDNFIFDKAAQAAAPLAQQLWPMFLKSVAYATPPLLGAAYLIQHATRKIEDQKNDLIKKTLLGGAGITLLGIGLSKLLERKPEAQPIMGAQIRVPTPLHIQPRQNPTTFAEKASAYRKLATIGAVDALLSMCEPTEKIAAARAINRSYGIYILSKMLD